MNRMPLLPTDTNSLDSVFADVTTSPKRHRLIEVSNRAYGMQMIFKDIQERLDWDRFVGAATIEDIEDALRNVLESTRERLPSSKFLLAVVREKTFPKAQKEAQIRFLGRSCATFGHTSPRRSRDLCEEAERLEKCKPRRGKIIRHEFYIECTCGYEGPAFLGACSRCGAKLRQRKEPVKKNSAIPVSGNVR